MRVPSSRVTASGWLARAWTIATCGARKRALELDPVAETVDHLVVGGFERVRGVPAVDEVANFALGCAAGESGFWVVYGWGRSWMIIQEAPNRSRSIPKRTAKKVSARGMKIWPPSDRRAQVRSASSVLSKLK